MVEDEVEVEVGELDGHGLNWGDDEKDLWMKMGKGGVGRSVCHLSKGKEKNGRNRWVLLVQLESRESRDLGLNMTFFFLRHGRKWDEEWDGRVGKQLWVLASPICWSLHGPAARYAICVELCPQQASRSDCPGTRVTRFRHSDKVLQVVPKHVGYLGAYRPNCLRPST